MCVDCFQMCRLSNFLTDNNRIGLDSANEQAQTMTNCSVPQNVLYDSHWTARCMDGGTTLLEEIQVPILIIQIFKRQCDICLVYFYEFIAFEKKTLTAHHTNFNTM